MSHPVDRLVSADGDAVYNVVPRGWHTFPNFLRRHPAWKSPPAYVFHRDKGVSVPQRQQQPSGLCYLHAPEVLQHYLVSQHQPGVGMIDMTKMIRRLYSARKLERHIFDDEGGYSVGVLKWILVANSVTFSSGFDQITQNLQRYGPGLVDGFEVFSDFYHSALHSFDGAPHGDFIGHHAMVLIGSRTDANGKQWFLLQNWWKTSQFVEVTEAYLRASSATVHFVVTPQKTIPNKFPTYDNVFAMNSNVDKPEQLIRKDTF